MLVVMKWSKIVFILCFCCPVVAFSQLDKGNKLFDDFHYSKAVKYYMEDVRNRDQRVAFEATMMLAECYIKMNDLQETIYWLQELERFEESHPDVFFDLGEAYRKSGQYTRAAEQFKQFNAFRPTDASLAYESYCQNIDFLEHNSNVEIRGVESINTENSEFSPVLWNDDLIFTSDRNSKVDGVYGWTNFGFCKVFSASHASSYDVFSFPKKPTFLKSKQINQNLHSGPLSIAGNQRSYFLTRTEAAKARRGMESETIHLSLEYGTVVGKSFKAGKSFPFNNSFYNVGHATLSFDGKIVIFSSDAPSGHGEGDLYISYASRGIWSEPENLGNVINGFGNEVFPYLANDTTLYFSSTTHFGFGGLDCFVSYKQRNGAWTKPQNMGSPINSSYDDFGFYLMGDGIQGYVCSDREGGMGADDIYAFQIGRPSNHDRTTVSSTRSRGVSSQTNPFKYTSYPQQQSPAQANVSQPKSIPVVSNRNTTNLKGGNFTGRVLNEETLEPVRDALVFVLHPSTHNVNVYGTDANGIFTVAALESELLVMHVLKKNCSEAYYQFRVPRENSWEHEMAQNLYIKEGGVREKVFTENVYFELNRHDLNREASRTLAEVVAYIRNIKGDYKIYLDAHTDVRASSQYNRDLSWKRAHQSMKYLVDHGVSSRLITIDWHGESNPTVGAGSSYSMSENAHGKNRRTEIRIEHMGEDNYPVSLDPDLYKPGDVVPMEILPMLFFNVTHLNENDGNY